MIMERNKDFLNSVRNYSLPSPFSIWYGRRSLHSFWHSKPQEEKLFKLGDIFSSCLAKTTSSFQTVNGFSFWNNDLFICIVFFSTASPLFVEVYFCKGFPDLGTAFDDS